MTDIFLSHFSEDSKQIDESTVKAAKEKLKKNKVLVLTGPAECGKTSLAVELAKSYSKDEVLMFSSPDKIETIDFQRTSLVIIDDFVGKYGFQREKVIEWFLRFDELNMAVTAGKLNIIVTCETTQLDKCNEIKSHPLLSYQLVLTKLSKYVKQESSGGPALDKSEKSLGLGWNTSCRFGLDSANGGGKQRDSQGSSTNIFHHLINQNNTGEVPDALAEEIIINDNEVQTDFSFNLNQQQQKQEQQRQQIQQHMQNALQHQFQQQQMQKQHLLNQQQQQQKQAMMNSTKQVLPQPSPRDKTYQQQQQQQQKSSYPVLINNKQPQQHAQLDQQQQPKLLQQQQHQTQISRQHQQQQSMQQQMPSQAQSQAAMLQQQHFAQQKMISQAQMQNRLLQQQQQQGLKPQSGQNMNMQQGAGRSKPFPQQHYNQHHQLVQQRQLSQQLVENSVEKIEEDLYRQLLQTDQEIEEYNMFGLPPVSVQHSQLQTVNNCDYLGSVRVNNCGNQHGSGDGRIRTMLTHSKETLQKKGNINVIDSCAPVNQNVQRQAISHGQVGSQVSGQQPRTPIITVSSGQRQNLTPQSQMVRSPMKSGLVQVPRHSMTGNRPTSTPTQSPVQVQTVSANHSLIWQPRPAMQKISKSNVILEGGGQFEEGQAYVIKDRHGNSRTMVWTNGDFVPYVKDKGTYNQSKLT